MSSTKTMNGTCSQCGYSGDHDIVAMHTNGIGFGFGMECPACGKLVPEQAWQKYQKTGDVVVPIFKMRTNNNNSYPKARRNGI